MSALGPLLAFFGRDKDRFPNFAAIELSPGTGWLLLLALLGAFLFVTAHKETWRRILLRLEDPRTLAVFRIVFALFTICNVNGLYEHWTYLFTDEGLWTTDMAQELRAKKQFMGFGDGVSDQEDFGFFSFAAFLHWLKGPNYSLLMFNSSPTFFWGHIIVFELAMVAFMVGWKTKYTKWIAWFCFHSITMRNTIYWEGTENIYRCWFFYLCLSRCGHAYSVDNWLRCRKLRKAGKLSERDGPGGGAGVAPSEAHPEGLAAIYRRVPAWPRMLMIMQTAFLYLDTGVVKNGGVWHAGDANYYATSLDHFYRMPTTQLGAWFGTTLFRLNSWVVHYWEACFPLILVGLVVRFRWSERLPRLSGFKLWMSRLGMLMLVVGFFGAVIYAYPVHFKQPKGSKLTAVQVQRYMAIGIPLVLIAYTLVVRWLMGRRERLKFVLDWVFSRRFWLGLGTIFHIHLIFLTNIGWFTPGAMATYICYFNGREISSIGQQLKRALGRVYAPWADAPEPIPTEDASLPHFNRDGHALGYVPIFTALGIALCGVLWFAHSLPDMWESMGNWANDRARYSLPEALREQQPVVRMGWVAWSVAAFLLTVTIRQKRGKGFDKAFAPVIVLGVAAVGYLRHQDMLDMIWCLPLTIVLTFVATRRDAEAPADVPVFHEGSTQPRTPWAYGPVGRLLAGSLFLFQILGISIWLLPAKDSISTFRIRAREPFKFWLLNTHTSQSWQMFAPNPPRSNLFMKVLVHDNDGEIYDLNTDVYACFDGDPNDPQTQEICDAVYPIPWIWYSRQRKMNRRIVGSEGGGGAWYQKWHARWICREWFMEHGELPDKVELIKVTYRIPKPEYVRKNGPYDPRSEYLAKHKEKTVHTTRCKTTPAGQVPNFVRERHGMETVDEKEIKTWKKNRCRRWEKHLKKEARLAGEEVVDDDPRFKVCLDLPEEPPKKMMMVPPKDTSTKTEPATGTVKRPAPARTPIKKTPQPEQR